MNFSSPSFLPVFESSKHIIGIIILLSERGLGFSFCLNRDYLLIISGFAILSGAVNYRNNGSPTSGITKLISRVVHELEMTGFSNVNHFRKVAETIVHIEEITMSGLGTAVSSKEVGPSLHDVGTPISPTNLQNLEMQSLREVTPLTESIAARANPQIEALSAVSLRRLDAQIMTPCPRSTPPTTPRRSSSVSSTISQGTVRGIQTMGVRPYDVDHIGFIYETAPQTGPTSTEKHHISKGSAGDDKWTTAFVDATQVPSIYGGGEDHTHPTVKTAMTSTAPTLAPDTWGDIRGYISHNTYDSKNMIHHYSDTLAPEQISPLGEECFGNMNDGLNQSQFTPSDLSDWQLWMV